jgi:hypothetical protein
MLGRGMPVSLEILGKECADSSFGKIAEIIPCSVNPGILIKSWRKWVPLEVGACTFGQVIEFKYGDRIEDKIGRQLIYSLIR